MDDYDDEMLVDEAIEDEAEEVDEGVGMFSILTYTFYL